MKPAEDKITTFLHGNGGSVLLVVVALVTTYVAMTMGKGVDFAVEKGLGLASPDTWLATGSASLNVAVAIATSAIMVLLNVRYNLLRDMTRLFAGLFLLMMAAQPALMLRFGAGSLMALVATLGVLLLYSTYNKPRRTQPIFLIFFIIASLALTQYAFLALIPVFFMGTAQMRAFNGRSFLASLLGIITPLWLCVAFGLIDFSDFRAPDFASITERFTPSGKLQFYVLTGFTMLTGLSLCVINLVKVFSYNSRSRSYNGFIALMLFVMCGIMAVDFTNIPAYLPLLCVCTAYQAAQFFVINIKKRSYIVILGIVAVYVSLYCWWMVS